jgi:hypothetical protein
MPGKGIAELLQAYAASVDSYRVAVNALLVARSEGESFSERRRLQGEVDTARLTVKNAASR